MLLARDHEPSHDASSSSKTLGLLQVKRVEALGEPAIDRGEKIVALLSLAPIAPQPRQGCSGTHFKGFRSLLFSDFETLNKTCFGLLCD